MSQSPVYSQNEGFIEECQKVTVYYFPAGSRVMNSVIYQVISGPSETVRPPAALLQCQVLLTFSVIVY